MDRDRLLRSGNEQNPPTNDRFEVGNPPYFCSVKLQIMNGNSKTFLLVLLGMLTAFGPFVTDMYLPTLPAMTDYFQTSSSMVQMGLTTSMIGLALGQLLFGPLSDKYGRRLPLLTALWLFIAATLLCIFATNIRQFIVMRFLQGIAGAGGIVISRSVATDRFAGRDLARMLALIGAVNGIAPVVAPIVGGTCCDSIGWRGIFCILLGLGCLLLAGGFRLRESLPREQRSTVAWSTLIRSFGTVLRNRRYRACILQLGFAQGVLFAYIASSPFLVQQHYGFSAFEFSLCFAVNAVAIGCAAAFSVRFRSSEQSTRIGCLGMVVFALAEALALASGCGFWVYEGLLFALLFSMGLTFTSSTALAMEAAREHAGTASALLGAVCFAFGGIVSPLVGMGNTLLSTGGVFVVCALCSWLSIRFGLRHAHRPAVAA